MTAHAELKKLIRARKEKTGEPYAAARVHVMRDRASLLGPEAEAPTSTEPRSVEAAVLKVNQQSARVRILGEAGQVTFRSGDVWQVVPGHVVTLVIERRWTWKGDAYANGRIEEVGIDVARPGFAERGPAPGRSGAPGTGRIAPAAGAGPGGRLAAGARSRAHPGGTRAPL